MKQEPTDQKAVSEKTYEDCFRPGIADPEQLNESEYQDALFTLNLLRTFCVADLAMERNEPQECNRLLNESMVYDCYSYIAQKTKNVSVCSVMSYQEDSDRCILGYIRMQSQNQSMCNDIKTPSIRDECNDLFEVVSDGS